MKILIVNDDGYTSIGIRNLAKALSTNHEVTVIAPLKCNSGMAHAMTFGKPIYLKKVDNPGENYHCYSISGTPADCVKLGAELMAQNPPDLVISGVNTEPNIGTTVVYSGTANAAMEASLLGYKAIAVSGNPTCDEDFEYIINFFMEHFDYYLSLCSVDYAINVNINNEKIGNISHKITPLGVRVFSDIYLVGKRDENGIPHTLVGNPLAIANAPDCDVTWYQKGYATITPLSSDNTTFTALKILKRKGKA
ncbi:MAG: 5'/3'-nucleotidase SurE [Clostridia bacterium]|nr:5'/3'-nucleotidase SurE [Clostridia bacterium]